MDKIDDCCIRIDSLAIIPKNPKKALEWIKEARKSPLDKAIEKMENSPYYDIWRIE